MAIGALKSLNTFANLWWARLSCVLGTAEQLPELFRYVRVTKLSDLAVAFLDCLKVTAIKHRTIGRKCCNNFEEKIPIMDLPLIHLVLGKDFVL